MSHRPEQNAYDEAYSVSGPDPASQVQVPFAEASPGPVVSQAVQQRKSHAWIVGIVVICAIALVCLIGIVSCNATLSSMVSSMGLYSAESEYTKAYEPSVAVIDISGTIEYDGSSSSPAGLKKLLDSADEDPNIKAVVLRVNSGGGAATAGEEMTTYVQQFEKPIVVSSAATNASAAYMISSQADYIFTERTTAIGSIGVAMQVTNLEGLYDKLGIDIENITSADSKDATYGTRPLTEEELKWYQDMVDQIDEYFIEVVKDGRDLSDKEMEELSNGLPYTGMDAVENGLADEIGTLEDAIEKASSLAGYNEALPEKKLSLSRSDISDLLDLIGYSNTSFGSNSKIIEKKLSELSDNVIQE